MKITIDQNSGFCFGVQYAIDKAEDFLMNNGKLYCLGEIVHNDVEVERLTKMGLITIDFNFYKNLKNEVVMLRAHGEPPETYKTALENNLRIIDASCPIVLRLQLKIHEKYLELKPKNGQIVIFGKKGHAEVIGLMGQTSNQAIVVSNVDDLNQINFAKPVALFSQTTMSSEQYMIIVDEIKNRLQIDDFYFQDSLCKQVANRSKTLADFCKHNDLIIFLSGKNSSNGKMLFEFCKRNNPNCKFVSNIDQIEKSWFNNVESVGITSATSTPGWLIKQTKEFIETIEQLKQ